MRSAPRSSLLRPIAVGAVAASALGGLSVRAENEGLAPTYVFCGTGDHLWGREREPVDSAATIGSMLEWMSKTYGIRRLYWRGGQTMMWDKHFKVGKETLPQHDWGVWKHHLYNNLKINEAAVAAAKRNGMEIFLYTGLLEFGVQPDIGIVCPYLLEDKLRIAHPEWCPVDRWGQRRGPGPLEFCYPEARKAVIDRYVENMERYGYDGINFYTYVENCGIRYEDEFGFNQPIVDEFNKRYPKTDLRKDALTAEQKEHWYQCRGKFVTAFLRELHQELASRGKKLSVILDANEPDYVQPWWSQPIAGSGKIRLEWQTWVREGIVDEIWVQLAAVEDQRATLDLVMKECKGTPVRLTVRAVDPYDDGWKEYVAAGVSPVAVITWARNGIERFSLEPTNPDTLTSPNWRLRLQTLVDIEEGRIQASGATVASLAGDPQVLVRRRVMLALAALKAGDQVKTLHEGLSDVESSVRMVAADALAKVNTAESPAHILAALEKDGFFQMKNACVGALAAMGEQALPHVLTGMDSAVYAVREVCTRALYKLGKGGLLEEVHAPLREVMRNSDDDEQLRYYALEGLVGLRLKLPETQQQQLAADLMALVESEASVTVRLRAAWGLGHMFSVLEPTTRTKVLATLAKGLRTYGDGCQRKDAAFGWRVFGNSMLQYHKPGRDALEDMRKQSDDKWLAWLAYEIKHLPARHGKIAQVDEQDAVKDHEKNAPPFPGYRTW
ncbi:MAG: family 10 glycosylhydrolase [Lentisphaeria bacterium]|nr:family 10 glycosylhydrolase [Lentisphaeria bacterium]